MSVTLQRGEGDHIHLTNYYCHDNYHEALCGWCSSSFHLHKPSCHVKEIHSCPAWIFPQEGRRHVIHAGMSLYVPSDGTAIYSWLLPQAWVCFPAVSLRRIALLCQVLNDDDDCKGWIYSLLGLRKENVMCSLHVLVVARHINVWRVDDALLLSAASHAIIQYDSRVVCLRAQCRN